MGKSTGNVIDLPTIESQGIRPAELRYYLAGPHYRSLIDYSEEAVQEAATGYRRIEGFVQRAAELTVGSGPSSVEAALPEEFVAAMNDDLNTSRALGIIHDLVREGNSALADGDAATVGPVLATLRPMLGILGLDPLSAPWAAGTGGTALRPVVDALVALALDQRTAARTRKDWAAADAVRDQLKQAGVVVEDTTSGPRWTIEGR